MYCDKCGEELRPGENFCGRCGAKVFAKDKEMDPYITALAVRLKNGEEEVFEEIYMLTKDKITKLAYAFYRSFEGDLEDDVQDIYVKAYRKIDTFDPEKGAFAGWLYVVARNCLIDKYKKRTERLKEEVSETLLAGDDDTLITFKNSDLSVVPEAAFDEKAVRSLLKDCMADLSDMQKACIIYRFYNQMSYKEISAILNVSEGSVKSGINAGKKKIEQNVLTLEKQGTKLYALPAVGFVTYLLSRDALSVEASAKVPEIVMHAANASPKAAAEAVKGGAQAAKGAAGKSLGMKVATVILAAAVGTGGAYYVKNVHSEKPDASLSALETQKDVKKEKTDEKAIKKEKDAVEDKEKAEEKAETLKPVSVEVEEREFQEGSMENDDLVYREVQFLHMDADAMKRYPQAAAVLEEINKKSQKIYDSGAEEYEKLKNGDIMVMASDWEKTEVMRSDSQIISVYQESGKRPYGAGSSSGWRFIETCNIRTQTGEKFGWKDILKDPDQFAAIANNALQNVNDRLMWVDAGDFVDGTEEMGASVFFTCGNAGLNVHVQQESHGTSPGEGHISATIPYDQLGDSVVDWIKK